MAVNPMDGKYRRGYVDRELPTVLGSDVSGTVEASRAAGFSEGDEVFGPVPIVRAPACFANCTAKWPSTNSRLREDP